MNDKDIVKVIQAHIDGKTIQFRRKTTDYEVKWRSCVCDPAWGFNTIDYRIKPEPRKFLLYSDKPEYFSCYEIMGLDGEEIEKIKREFKYTFEVTEDLE